jgi:hypothetical protein
MVRVIGYVVKQQLPWLLGSLVVLAVLIWVVFANRKRN